MVVSPAQGVVRLREQRGGDYRTDSGQGSQDGHVALFLLLPRRRLPAGAGFGIRVAEPAEERLELRLRPGDLVVEHGEPLREQAHVRLRGAHRGRVDVQRALRQPVLQGGAVEAPDAVLLQTPCRTSRRGTPRAAAGFGTRSHRASAQGAAGSSTASLNCG